MGAMDWDSANAKCRSIGSRLPTNDELIAAFKVGLTKSWQKDGDIYWSSTPYDAERYYHLDVYRGDTNYGDRFSNYDVRCHR